MHERFVEDAAGAVLGAVRELVARGLVEGTSGNVSARRPDGTVCVTPASVPYGTMTAGDLVVVDCQGTLVAGRWPASSELALHLACYAAFPEIAGVVHCHAVHASMFAVARRPLPAAVDEVAMVVGGDVAVAEYAPSGSAELGRHAVRHLADRGAVLLANHGMVAVGRSPADAMHVTAVVERTARIVAGAVALGGPVPVPAGDGHDLAATYRAARLARR